MILNAIPHVGWIPTAEQSLSSEVSKIDLMFVTFHNEHSSHKSKK